MIETFILIAGCLFVIFIVFFVHEMGHYLMARIFGERVESVVLGYGREVWGRTSSGGTVWSVRIFPLIAHVSLAGFSGSNATKAQSIKSKDVFRRSLVILAGPFANLVAPFILFAVFFVLADQPTVPPLISGVEIEGTADQAGFEVGDRIVAVNGRPINSWREMERYGYHDRGEVSYDVKRDGQVVNLKVTHSWVDYSDIDGIKRSHSRLGVIFRQKPFNFSALYHINDEVVDDHPEKIKSSLLNNAGKSAVIGLHSNDVKIHEYRVMLPAKLNDHFLEKEDEEKDFFHIGKFKDNLYVERGLRDGTREAAYLTLKIISGVASIPFQALPIDPYVMEVPGRIHDELTALKNKAYNLIYTFSVISVFMGLINLIPLPRLDGGQFLLLIFELVTKKPLTPRQQLFVFVTVFSMLYLSIFITNIDNLPHYVDSRMKKVREFLEET